MPTEHFDVLIIGAGLSGIDAGWHLQQNSPKRTYVILENRERIGGTWDLFRYPGIRSDSRHADHGLRLPPVDAPERDLAGRCDPRLRHRHGQGRRHRQATSASATRWRAPRGTRATARWTVEAKKRDANGREETVQLTANFLFSCAGYYRYSDGYTPEFAGRESFKGTIIHPQHWPENLELRRQARRRHRLGRDRGDARPHHGQDRGPRDDAAALAHLLSSRVRKRTRSRTSCASVLPASWAYVIPRWRNIVLQRFFFNLARKKPEKT